MANDGNESDHAGRQPPAATDATVATQPAAPAPVALKDRLAAIARDERVKVRLDQGAKALAEFRQKVPAGVASLRLRIGEMAAPRSANAGDAAAGAPVSDASSTGDREITPAAAGAALPAHAKPALARFDLQRLRGLKDRLPQIDANKIAALKAQLARFKPLPLPPQAGDASARRVNPRTGLVPGEAFGPRATIDVPATVTVSTTRRIEQATQSRGWLVRLAATVLTAGVAGGIIHIVTTFAIPMLGVGSAFNRVRDQLAVNRMVILPAQAPGQHALPFLSPDMRYAMCRYDVSAGAVEVRAVLPELGWSLGIYTPQGDNFYAVPGLEAKRTEVVFTILPASDRLVNLAPGVRKADVDATQVTSPQRDGLVVVRAPIKGAAFTASVEAALRGATCQAARR